MNDIRMVGLDLDGTLLNSQKQISERTRSALEKAHAQGTYLVPVTGRPHEGIPKLVRTLPFVRYIISCNGALIRDEREGTVVREKLIPHRLSLALSRILKQHGAAYEVLYRGVGYSEAWVYDGMVARNPNNPFLPRYIQETRKIVPDLEAFIREEEKGLEELFIMAGSEEKKQAILAALAALPPLNVVFPAPAVIEITAQGVDKGEALLDLAKALGISRDSVMAVGDSGNDLAMLQAAAMPVAMENATEEVKTMAKFVTASNDDHGVALAVERYILGKNT